MRRAAEKVARWKRYKGFNERKEEQGGVMRSGEVQAGEKDGGGSGDGELGAGWAAMVKWRGAMDESDWGG